jgi:transposase
MKDIMITKIRDKFKRILFVLDERSKRLWAASEAISLGWGGIGIVHQATGISEPTIRAGIRELKLPSKLPLGRCRQSGGGKKKSVLTDTGLVESLNKLIDPVTRGDPMSPLRWTTKSLRHLARELTQMGHPIGITTVRQLLKSMGYSLQSNRKTREGLSHPDRNEQFEYINKQIQDFSLSKQPVISVDTKKKENLGNFSNKGREYQPKRHPVETNMYDFPDKELGKAIPYGVYDLVHNLGFVNVGIDHDTSEFAVNSIRTWWKEMGHEKFPHAKRLLITADSGGSNGRRTHLWKIELQKLANELGIEITVCHFPPGTSKWNKIEHKLFSFISKNWRAQPLKDMATVVNLISHTETTKGLKIRCTIDENKYQKGIKITNKELENINIKTHNFHPEWNYSIAKK